MQRNYLGRRLFTALRPPRAAGRTALCLALTALSGAAAALLPTGVVRAGALFDALPVDNARFAVLARAVGRDDWSLLVLEQLRPERLCWQTRTDGLVDPSLNRFDYTGICGRYIDSNGYSLRLAGAEGSGEGSAGLRLHVEPVAGELQLQASSADLSGVIVVGRAPLPPRQRDAFVPIRLEPGWELQRRSYGGQALNHLYFSHRASARDLLAQPSGNAVGARSRLAAVRGVPPLAPPPPPPLTAEIAPARRGRQPRTISQARLSTQPPAGSPSWSASPDAQAALPLSQGPEGLRAPAGSGRVIALQVIPFQE